VKIPRLNRTLYFWFVNVCFARAKFPVREYCTRASNNDEIYDTFIASAESWLLNRETSSVFFKIT
jgi:hypothetical protein